ncbi:hypothetical protein EVAR_51176_1 [Eumeta japonica]|uniref:Uncharacterized protein n=1 Tax=Eumeta variegata TaxID=151549 RepID=A0A4C1XF17_EUMVA|nr:hypothetical protein EVAR_51176_1 [Eumeta japonica]
MNDGPAAISCDAERGPGEGKIATIIEMREENVEKTHVKVQERHQNRYWNIEQAQDRKVAHHETDETYPRTIFFYFRAANVGFEYYNLAKCVLKTDEDHGCVETFEIYGVTC